MGTLSDMFWAGLEKVRKSWGWLLALGILLIILRVLCIGTAQTAVPAALANVAPDVAMKSKASSAT